LSFCFWWKMLLRLFNELSNLKNLRIIVGLIHNYLRFIKVNNRQLFIYIIISHSFFVSTIFRTKNCFKDLYSKPSLYNNNIKDQLLLNTPSSLFLPIYLSFSPSLSLFLSLSLTHTHTYKHTHLQDIAVKDALASLKMYYRRFKKVFFIITTYCQHWALNYCLISNTSFVIKNHLLKWFWFFEVWRIEKHLFDLNNISVWEENKAINSIISLLQCCQNDFVVVVVVTRFDKLWQERPPLQLQTNSLKKKISNELWFVYFSLYFKTVVTIKMAQQF